jgi:hypothetical protein
MDRDAAPGPSRLPIVMLGAMVVVLVVGGGALAYVIASIEPAPVAAPPEPKAEERPPVEEKRVADPDYRPPPSVRIEDATERTAESIKQGYAEKLK